MVVVVVGEGFWGMGIPRGRARRRLLDLDGGEGVSSDRVRKPGKVLGSGCRVVGARWTKGV